MRVLELFAGAGGAALGLEAAGFTHAALVEWDEEACATLTMAEIQGVLRTDVRSLDLEPMRGIDLLWSSFPCQPFSTAGKSRSQEDDRNGWPGTVRALDRVSPTWFVGENVPGLLRHKRSCAVAGGPLAPSGACPGCYLELSIMPDLRARFAHVHAWVLDAADHGVAQHRVRLFLVAGPAPLAPPTPTHGPQRAAPWVSAADALGLPAEEATLQAGVCRVDKGRRGAARPLSRPSPTIASASFMYLRSGDAIRKLTVRECSAIQGFPVDYPFCGRVMSQYRQVGNAVPPRLAEAVARVIARAQEGAA